MTDSGPSGGVVSRIDDVTLLTVILYSGTDVTLLDNTVLYPADSEELSKTATGIVGMVLVRSNVSFEAGVEFGLF